MFKGKADPFFQMLDKHYPQANEGWHIDDSEDLASS